MVLLVLIVDVETLSVQCRGRKLIRMHHLDVAALSRPDGSGLGVLGDSRCVEINSCASIAILASRHAPSFSAIAIES